MRKSRFSEEQIIGVLKQAENGRAIPELAREYGVTETTLYRWHRQLIARKYDGGESRRPHSVPEVGRAKSETKSTNCLAVDTPQISDLRAIA